MKLYIHCNTAISTRRRMQLERAVRDAIYFTYFDTKYFGDPDSTSEKLKSEFLDAVTHSSYADWVYAQRFDLFEDAVKHKIDTAVKNPDEIEYAFNYFNSLSKSDYNRLLFLVRDGKELKRK